MLNLDQFFRSTILRRPIFPPTKVLQTGLDENRDTRSDNPGKSETVPRSCCSHYSLEETEQKLLEHLTDTTPCAHMTTESAHSQLVVKEINYALHNVIRCTADS